MHSDEVRIGVARVEYPRVLLWTSALLLVLSVLNYIEEPEAPLAVRGLDVVASAILASVGLAMLWLRPPGWLLPWMFAAGAASLLAVLLGQVVIDQKPVTFVYVAITLTALGPTVLAWKPFYVVSAAALASIGVIVATWEPGHGAEWVLVSLAALLVSSVLLRTRLRSIDALADSAAAVLRLATTDELTGLLNRHGLQSQLPHLVAMSTRLDSTVFAVFVDIDGLKGANDGYGHAFGDDVIKAAARAVLASVRGGDFVARYGGDEIVVVGIGSHPDPAAFAGRLEEHVTASGISRVQWPGGLSVGFAEGDPAQIPVDELIERADADMYGRRALR